MGFISPMMSLKEGRIRYPVFEILPLELTQSYTSELTQNGFF